MLTNKRKVKQMSKQIKEAPVKKGPTLQLKQSFLRGYDFLMFLGATIGAYILYFNGNTTALKVVAGVLVLDAAVHMYKLVAVVK
jgi:hypothetical protein